MRRALTPDVINQHLLYEAIGLCGLYFLYTTVRHSLLYYLLLVIHVYVIKISMITVLSVIQYCIAEIYDQKMRIKTIFALRRIICNFEYYFGSN